MLQFFTDLGLLRVDRYLYTLFQMKSRAKNKICKLKADLHNNTRASTELKEQCLRLLQVKDEMITFHLGAQVKAFSFFKNTKKTKIKLMRCPRKTIRYSDINIWQQHITQYKVRDPLLASDKL